jgi:cytochrome c oxidase subunit 3
MEIPYTVTARQDTGLWNAKIGVWLFLASEAMLFGGLFSGYIFLRLGAPAGFWPHGLLNVPVGTFNTAILIASSITVVFSWAALKMRQFNKYRFYMALTIALATVFLVIKLGYEWPQKFGHFGAYIKPEAMEKYEKYLGNKHLASEGLTQRTEITGHLELPKGYTGIQQVVNDPKVTEYEIAVDPVNADPTNPENDRPHFWHQAPTNTIAKVEKADVEFASAFVPRHSSYLAAYFTITGLHALHVLGGLVIFIYYMLPVSTKLYRQNPEHLSNRVEVAGLYWHFVDLVWIFVFPIFYLL